MQINVNNSDSADIFVTMTDLNTATPGNPVLNNSRLNQGSSSVSVQVQDDSSGNGNVAWTAVRCNDPGQTKSGRATPAQFDTVDVSAY
jgi:hypothetical protein